MEFATASFTHVTIHNSSSKAHTLHFTLSTSGSLNWTSWLTLAKLSYSKFHFVVATNATWQLSPKTPCTWQHLRFTLYTTHSRYNSISKKNTLPSQISHSSISSGTPHHRLDVLSFSFGMHNSIYTPDASKTSHFRIHIAYLSLFALHLSPLPRNSTLSSSVTSHCSHLPPVTIPVPVSLISKPTP